MNSTVRNIVIIIFLVVVGLLFLGQDDAQAKSGRSLAMIRKEVKNCERRHAGIEERKCTIRVIWPDGWHEDNKAVQVAVCETTTINPRRWDGATGRTYYGVWQADKGKRSGGYGYYGHTVFTQTLVAVNIRKAHGWGPWGCA